MTCEVLRRTIPLSFEAGFLGKTIYMGRKQLTLDKKVKRMTFGITPEALVILQAIPKLQMSKFVSECIISNYIKHA